MKCKDAIRIQHEIIHEEYEALKEEELIMDHWRDFWQEFNDHEKMIQQMLDLSIEKQTKHLKDVKAQMAKLRLKFVVSDESKIGGLPWSILKQVTRSASLIWWIRTAATSRAAQ